MTNYYAANLGLQVHYGKTPYRSKILRPNVVITCPTSSAEGNNRAILDIAKERIAKDAVLTEELTALVSKYLFGEGYQIPGIFLHIGAGTTACGVFGENGLEFTKRILYAGNYFDRLIQRALFEKTKCRITLWDCLNIKHEVGRLGSSINHSWKGIVTDVSGKEIQVNVTSNEIETALEKGLESIAEEFEWYLSGLPESIIQNAKFHGIKISGGCGNLLGIDTWLSKRLGMKTSLLEQPDLAVINGMRLMLKQKIVYKVRK